MMNKRELGVDQGVPYPLSSNLFNATMEETFRKLEWEHCGIKINEEYLSHLRFADDIVILVNYKEEMRIIVTELVNESKKVGLKFNMRSANKKGESKIVIEEKTLVGINTYAWGLSWRFRIQRRKGYLKEREKCGKHIGH